MNHTLSLIAAMDRNRLLGAGGVLPWHLPNDLQWFKACTVGKPVLMGRSTWESLGRALPHRPNIVLTSRSDLSAPGARLAHSLQEALDQVADYGEIMIIGGGAVFDQTITLADRLYLTVVQGDFTGDTWFPLFDTSDWQETYRSDQAPDERNPHRHSFLIWDRVGD
jgi:dihydrofolate reductase